MPEAYLVEVVRWAGSSEWRHRSFDHVGVTCFCSWFVLIQLCVRFRTLAKGSKRDSSTRVEKAPSGRSEWGRQNFSRHAMRCNASWRQNSFSKRAIHGKNWEVVKSPLTGSKGSCLSRSTANAQNQPKLQPAAIDIQREMLQCSYPYAGAYTNPLTHTKLHEPTHAHYIQNFDMLSLSAFVTNTCRTQLESPSRKQQFLCGMFFLKCITHRCPVTRTRTQPSASTPDGDQST